eukprot:TRINITY_DN67563_c0_g1_i1.p1 TRINITY_DN67563_c0_g1~~TRINITY_DN67563_c0_g1_i1.p1  ORF type:complete len:314 (+),score=28.62 TRINITY_DN67563_c0_g1_i1:121-1062(+)
MSEDESRFPRQSSARLFRATSATFTGGVTLFPDTGSEPTENTPLNRQQSTRRTIAQDQVHQRLVAEASHFASRFRAWLILLCVLIIIVILFMLILLVRAIFASILYFSRPCDEPLQYYMLITLIWSQFPGGATKMLQEWFALGPITSLIVGIVMSLPGWFIIGYGVYMVTEAKTCPKTNPGLYYPLKDFIYGQIVFAALALILTTCGAFGLRRALLILNKLSIQPGCEKAVRELPRVKSSSEELIDPEDGKVMDCCICIEALDCEKTVVKAPCGHHFHEECLCTWCRNHLDCPLCRQQIGEADDLSPQPSEVV